MEACKDGCKYFIRISDGVWNHLKEQGTFNSIDIPESQTRLNFCAANSKFIKSVIFACSVKDHGMQEEEFKGLKDYKLGEA